MPALDSKPPFVLQRRDMRGMRANAWTGTSPVLAILNGSYRPEAAKKVPRL